MSESSNLHIEVADDVSNHMIVRSAHVSEFYLVENSKSNVAFQNRRYERKTLAVLEQDIKRTRYRIMPRLDKRVFAVLIQLVAGLKKRLNVLIRDKRRLPGSSYYEKGSSYMIM